MLCLVDSISALNDENHAKPPSSGCVSPSVHDDKNIRSNSIRLGSSNNLTTNNGYTQPGATDLLERHTNEREPSQHDGLVKRCRSLADDAKSDAQINGQLLNTIQAQVHGQPSGLIQEMDVIDDVSLESGNEQITKLAEHCPIYFPRHISELDNCNHLLVKFEPELDSTHLGFGDLEYRHRRKELAEIAFNYRYGEPIPIIVYNEKEIGTWRCTYINLKEAYAKYACEQHNKAIMELESNCDYSPNSIPQLQQVSEFLARKTGWRLRPAAGWLTARDFLASLAFRVFQTTQYIRHHGNPQHSVEPDCIHELMGHIPMFCDPEFAQFSQELGLVSLGASDEQIEKFATLYWFTIEFGLCHERGQLKCYGAALLSSYGEMEYALESGRPKLKDFLPEETAVEARDDVGYQHVYYVAQSFDDAKTKIKQYAMKNLQRDFELVYEPLSCSIKELDSLEQLDAYVNQIKNDVARLSSAISKLILNKDQKQ